MILKTYPNKNLYGKYFLATEAPDDEVVTEDQPKPRRNVKVISVKPSNRGKDFTQIEDPLPQSDDENPTVNPENSTDTSSEPDINNEEQVQPDTEPSEVSDTNNDQDDVEDGPIDTDNTDFTADIDSNNSDTGEDAPDVNSDNTDFTNNAEGQPAPDNTTSNTSDNKPNAPGVELDSTRKYNLYKEYMSLYNACDNYISKLENILKNDFEENQIIRISVNNLREVKDILFDYMTIRFSLNTYVQSLLFYQKMVVAVQLVFNLLKSIKSNNIK